MGRFASEMISGKHLEGQKPIKRTGKRSTCLQEFLFSEA